MADSKISELTALTSAASADADLIAVVDTDAAETKSMTLAELDARALSGIADQSSATVATGDLLVINDIDDSNNPKQVTAQSVANLASISPVFTDEALTVGGGGTLTYDTDYNRFYVFGKILFWQFSITQTAAGSGTADLTFPAPTGVTLLDSKGCGHASTNDIANGNAYRTMSCEAINSTNLVKIQNDGTQLYIRGGNMIGNNGVVNIAAVICCEIA
jgi:hypothetical protein